MFFFCSRHAFNFWYFYHDYIFFYDGFNNDYQSVECQSVKIPGISVMYKRTCYWYFPFNLVVATSLMVVKDLYSCSLCPLMYFKREFLILLSFKDLLPYRTSDLTVLFSITNSNKELINLYHVLAFISGGYHPWDNFFYIPLRGRHNGLTNHNAILLKVH